MASADGARLLHSSPTPLGVHRGWRDRAASDVWEACTFAHDRQARPPAAGIVGELAAGRVREVRYGEDNNRLVVPRGVKDAGMPSRRVARVIDSTGAAAGTAMATPMSAASGEQPASADMPSGEGSIRPDQPMAPQPEPPMQQPVQPEQPATPPCDQPQSGTRASSAEVD